MATGEVHAKISVDSTELDAALAKARELSNIKRRYVLLLVKAWIAVFLSSAVITYVLLRALRG